MRQILWAILVFSTCGCGASAAATYHVDWDRGDDSGDGLTPESAWKTPWTAAERVRGGDTVVLHARADGRPYQRPGCKPVFAVEAPDTTWTAAPGETVRLSTTGDFETPPWEYCGGKGSTTVYVDAPRTVVAGFHIWGSVFFNKNADDSVIEDCDLSGGGDYQGFPAVIRTSGKPPNRTPDNWCDGIVVRHNRIHDNVPALDQGTTNDTLILTYGASDMVVEYNEFFGGLHSGIKWKDRANRMTARYNRFRDMPVGVQGDGQRGVDWIATHDNVFERLSRQAVAVELGAPTSFLVYNNTFVDNRVDIGWWHGLGRNLEVFNNVFLHRDKGQYYQFYDERWRRELHGFADYNVYAGREAGASWVLDNRPAAAKLKGWRKVLDGHEIHSVEQEIGWDGGRLEGGLPEGRGGEWPAEVGARLRLEDVGPRKR